MITAFIIAALCTPALAASVDSPPEITASEAGQFSEEPIPIVPKELTPEEMEQIGKEMSAGQKRSANPELWPKTKIEETVDNHNVVTEVKVTPGSTQIPYTMTRVPPSNQSKSGPGSENTMSVPKFINFGF